MENQKGVIDLTVEPVTAKPVTAELLDLTNSDCDDPDGSACHKKAHGAVQAASLGTKQNMPESTYYRRPGYSARSQAKQRKQAAPNDCSMCG